jgi:hypothetical protein
MSETKTHTLNLTKGAVSLLKTTLGMPGWYEGAKVSVTVRAADIMENPAVSDVVLPEDLRGDAAKEDAWAKEASVLVLTEGEREAAKVCIRHFLKKAQLAPSKHTRALIKELGIEDD